MGKLTLPKMRKTRRVGVITGIRERRAPSRTLPLRPRGPTRLDITPPEVAAWMEKVSRERAMKAYRLKQSGVNGTLPELLTYAYLTKKGHIFDFQSSIMGGRIELGGAVADFIIYTLNPQGLVVWRIQGDYWHTMPERVERDQIQKERLLTEHHLGKPVTEVTDLWESRIYGSSPAVFEAAEAGVELGRLA